ncbi:MAG: hypothetical protein JRI97_11815 [Deltaproteobacteria bacterium]|nr:hypothetical protein [Deltaproteobacteria bacterium]
MPFEDSTPRHCPGFQNFRQLSSFTCKCPECGTEIEIFSDEFDKPQTCPGCKKPVDFTRCTLEGSGGKNDPR